MSESTVETSRSPRRRLPLPLVVVLSLAAGLALGYAVYTPRVTVEDISATVLEPPRAVEDFALTTHHGAPFTLDSLKGRWSFVFFGYTHCPDVCPSTLYALAQVARRVAEVGADHRPLQVVFVTVDPERDTPERLAGYVPYFDESFLGVTGSQADINRFTRQLGILHMRTEREGVDGYLVDHTASVLLFNPEARLRVLFPAPHGTASIVEDFLKVVQL